MEEKVNEQTNPVGIETMVTIIDFFLNPNQREIIPNSPAANE